MLMSNNPLPKFDLSLGLLVIDGVLENGKKSIIYPAEKLPSQKAPG